MSLKIANRIAQTTTTTGLSDFQLVAPDANRTAFDDGVTSGEEVVYLAENATGTEWEYGRGVITSGTPDQLTRVTIIASSNANAKVSFSAGTKTIYNLVPSQMTLWAGSSDAWAYTDIASAITTDLGSLNTLGANITGTTTVNSFGVHKRTLRMVRFAATLTLTYNATSMKLLTGTDRKVIAGASGLYASDASGNWTELLYQNPVIEFLAYRSADVTSFWGDTSINTIVCNTEVYDHGGCYNNSTGVWTAPAAGELEVNYRVGVTDAGGVAPSGIRGLLSGSTFGDVYSNTNYESRSGFASTGYTEIIKLTVAAGETVTLKDRSTSSGAAKNSTLLGGRLFTYFSGKFTPR